MLIKPVLTPSGKPIFRLRPGQLLIGGAMLAVIGILILLSFAGFQAQNSSKETLLAEESDSSALIFVQREAFGFVIAVEEYLLDQGSREPLLLARATLAQRLNVITSTGDSTFSVAGEDFRLALQSLDALATANQEIESTQQLRAATDEFLTQTRKLTDIFQDVSRSNIQKAINERATVDLWQGGLSILALTLGFILFVWVVRDLTQGFRIGYQEITDQSESITKAEQDFIAIQMLDERIAEWNIRVAQGDDLELIVSEVRAELGSIARDGRVVVSSQGELEVNLGEGFDVQATATRRLLETRLRELITQIQRQNLAKQQLEWERNHDGLTKLLNRRGIGRELTKRLQSEKFEPFALFDIDLDGFTNVNNALGQEFGDRILKEVAAKLESLEILNLSAARIAADEFGLLAPIGNSSPEEILEKVEAAVRYESSFLEEAPLVSSCIGYHLVQPGESADEAAAKTGAALKAAKAAGKPGTTMRYEEAEHGHLLTDYLEQITFRNALLAGDVIPYLQPIVDLATREVVGYEALARWKSNEGVITPDRFIPIATAGGLLDELFEVILEHVAKNWKRFTLDKPGVYVSVNVDPKTLQVTDFADRVQREIFRFKLEPTDIVLEITEQSLVDSSRVAQLEALRDLGVRIALDDFGTGYSSLSQLASLPIDTLKVDRSFIVDGVEGPAGEMLRTIRQMASSANLKVVVEGIETEEMALALTNFGFESGQGYLFGKPEDLLAE